MLPRFNLAACPLRKGCYCRIMENQKDLFPTATASTSQHKTASGKALLKVRVLTPGAVDWRTYTYDPDTPREEMVARALRSLGLGAAWVQGMLH